MAGVPMVQQLERLLARSLPGKRFDHFFFSCLAWLMLTSVFIGFAPSYYVAGILHAPLPSPAIHVHAVVFSLWIVVLIAQTGLTAAGQVSIHRRLGIAGFILALLMPALGLWAATDLLVRRMPGPDPQGIYLVAVTNVVAFGVLISFAFRARFDSAAHKRLVMIASIALMTAAIARWRFDWSHLGREIHMSVQRAECVSYVFILLLVAYDFWATRRIHRSTIWGSALLVITQQLALQLGQTSVWHSIASWLQSLLRD
jgi:hypothetical protein